MLRRTMALANANALSRLPLSTEPEVTQAFPEMVLLFQHLDISPITAKHIEENHKDVFCPQWSCILDKVGPIQLIHDLNYNPTLKGN